MRLQFKHKYSKTMEVKVSNKPSVFKRFQDWFYPWCLAFGLDPYTTKRAIKGILPTIKDYRHFKSQVSDGNKEFPIAFSLPRFSDRIEAAGIASGHYFHQDLFVARRIFERQPLRHVDVASRIDGFVAHVAVYRQIEVFDIRAMESQIPNIIYHQSDMMQPQNEYLAYCDSLSCLHALEHFGLGRYGEPIQFNGHKVAFDNLLKILMPGGILYLSVPIGPQRIEFNGHRVFAIPSILAMAGERFKLLCFSYVDDAGDFHEDQSLDDRAVQQTFGCKYGCGIFEFQKI